MYYYIWQQAVGIQYTRVSNRTERERFSIDYRQKEVVRQQSSNIQQRFGQIKQQKATSVMIRVHCTCLCHAASYVYIELVRIANWHFYSDVIHAISVFL